MDFAFMRASTSDFSRPNPAEDRVVQSFDGFNSHLLIVDEESRQAWIFLLVSKEPPVEEASAFLKIYGVTTGGMIRCDQGGELARSHEFITEMEKRHGYSVEPTSSDGASQNGGAERYNDTFAVTTRALLYGAALPAQYWSAALRHTVYLHNRKVHTVTKKTPFEAWWGKKPDLSRLKLFGSRVCVKRTGKRRAKLDRHDFSGIFLGYTSTDQNIVYIDLNSGIVKTCHHAVFDEAWYLQPSRPPAAQLLYDLGLSNEHELVTAPILSPIPVASYPPLPTSKPLLLPVRPAKQLPIPFRITESPSTLPTAAAAASAQVPQQPMLDPYANTILETKNPDGTVVDDYGITRRDVVQVYISPHPYHNAFEEELGLRGFDSVTFPTAGFVFQNVNSRLIVRDIKKSTPAAKIL